MENPNKLPKEEEEKILATYMYDLPDIEPGRCFFDDHDPQHYTFFRFKERTRIVGDYNCDMLQFYDHRIIFCRNVRCNSLLEFKEMEARDFDKLEKLALTQVAAMSSLCKSIKEDLKKRHSRMIKRPKQD